MVSLRGVGVSIVCEGQTLPMYREAFDGTTATAYIASCAGKKFSIHDHNTTQDDFNYTVSLDGKCVGSWISHRNNKGHISGVRSSSTTLRPFEFVTLQVIEENTDGSMQTDVSKLGLIEMCFYRTEITGPSTNQILFKELDTGPVSEKAKKVGWHRASLGSEQPISQRGLVQSVNIDKEPFITFKIRYQPEELLRAHGIMPMLPRSDPIPPSSNAGSSTLNGTGDKRPHSSPIAAGSSEERPQKRRKNAEPSSSSPSKVAKPEPLDDNVLEIDNDSDDEAIRRAKEELDKAIMRKQLRNKIKSERAVSPIIVGEGAGDVIDLTLD
ncbi:uncharacterized protein STEHIDRAFT_122164 [Stereum hirsutum FP-91666 SS1]|uniref:uncharacterized protein n=1 Tax=Stereum hirsutum (strain FP-91666) TaxID=721885 RepID=UPI0004449C68|nr:uncharacterized protein STEHIDRAFT_122164 [Stereum hirsutum FP-91666 SS1]EIM86217.1 hypothetical protein STEHIDRAFT_122164 [Stereum hirsutum FP-91666 SS1]